MEKLIDKIIELEWMFFGLVRNEGGRASCQDDWETFRVMRRSQFMAWTVPVLESWLDDLLTARAEGRNPLTEKYGYMMCIAAPQENRELSERLPAVPDETKVISRKIIDRLAVQNAAFAGRYPLIAGQARPLRTKDEREDRMTSIETYQTGELWTYSQRTLELLDAHLKDLETGGVNYPELVIGNSLRQRGFSSLEEAEGFLASKRNGCGSR